MSLPLDFSQEGSGWRFACPDWFERLQAGNAPIPDLPLNKENAERALRIFSKLRLPDVDDKPPLGDACGEWFKALVRVVGGSVDDDGVRHIPEIFALVGKKNSKTTYSGGLMLTLLLLNKTPRAEILFVGPTQEIADTAFQSVVGMIEEDEEGYLQKRFLVQDHKKRILDRVTKAFIKIKTFDMKVMTGSKPIIVLIDELHIMGSIHYASRVIRQIRGALVRRRDSLLLIISTQSDEAPAGAFKAELDYARGVREGKIVGHVRMLPMMYEFPEKMQLDPEQPWADPKNWHLVMPNLGLSLHLDTMVADYEAERLKGREAELIWLSQHLTIQVGMATHDDRWIGGDYWAAAAYPGLSVDWLIENCDVITAGVDGGGLDDMFGVSLIGRHHKTREWYAVCRGWVHPEVLDRRKEIAERLRDFAKEGKLVICEDDQQDLREAAELLARVHKEGRFPEKHGIGLDPYGVAAFVDELALHGLVGEQLAAIGQGTRLTPAVWGTERKLKDGTFWHDGSELMAWCVGNAKAEQRGNAVLITKQTAGKAKIDPLVALFNAAMLMSRNPEANRMNIDDFLANPVMVGV